MLWPKRGQILKKSLRYLTHSFLRQVVLFVSVAFRIRSSAFGTAHADSEGGFQVYSACSTHRGPLKRAEPPSVDVPSCISANRCEKREKEKLQRVSAITQRIPPAWAWGGGIGEVTAVEWGKQALSRGQYYVQAKQFLPDHVAARYTLGPICGPQSHAASENGSGIRTVLVTLRQSNDWTLRLASGP